MATVLLQGTVLTGAGVAVVGATVEVLDFDTTTVRSTFAGGTDANGDWNFTYAPGANPRRVDVRITNGTSISVLKFTDQIQVSSVETANLRIINPAFTFEYDIVPAAINAARQLNLPLITATDTLAVLGLAQTFTEAITLSAATGNVLVVDTNVLVVDATNNRVGIGTASPTAELSFGGTNATICMATSDAADNGALNINGGGAGGGGGNTRGSSIGLYGNEHASTGSLDLEAGNVVGGVVNLRTAAAIRATLDRVGNLGIGTATFGTSAEKVLALLTGVAPTTGPADTVQFYSTDDAAGHTIPSFFCEGTNVLATGQADSASSVRVKVRINGTVVTLLGI